MKALFGKQQIKPLYLLLIGNNPIEMGDILLKIQQFPGKEIKTEIAFDLKSMQERLNSFAPDFIIIDDNIGKEPLAAMVASLINDKRTKASSITILKNSNYTESSVSVSILDYLLKQNFSIERLVNTIKNSLKIRRAQSFFSQHKSKSKVQFT